MCNTKVAAAWCTHRASLHDYSQIPSVSYQNNTMHAVSVLMLAWIQASVYEQPCMHA